MQFKFNLGKYIMKRYIFLILIILLMNFCLGEDITELEPYKQNSQIDIKVHCQHSGGSCSGSAGCNITLEYPNNRSYMLFNEPMTQNLSFYNYTLPDSSNLGWHYMTVYCVDGIFNNSMNYKFEITETGDESSTLFIYIIELFMKIGFFIFLIVLCIWGIRAVKKSEKTPYKMVALLRSLWAGSSYAMLIISPLIALFLFHPNFSIGIVQRLTLNTYLVLAIIASPIILFNIFYFGGNILLKLGGLHYDAERTDKVLNDFDRFSGGLSRWKNKLKNKMFKR